eukprot:364945-Chlamydomonas_euryale.AAC.3
MGWPTTCRLPQKKGGAPVEARSAVKAPSLLLCDGLQAVEYGVRSEFNLVREGWGGGRAPEGVGETVRLWEPDWQAGRPAQALSTRTRVSSES